MAMPDSVKETYEDFLKRYRAHVEGNTFTHWRTIYADACEEPLDPALVVFVWHGAVTGSDRMYQMLQYWCRHREEGSVTVRVIIARKAQLETMPELPGACVLAASDANRPQISRLYAQAGCIVTAGWLPAFFVKREGQRVLNLYEPLDSGGSRARLKNAGGRLSSFLNSSAICVSGKDQCREVCQNEQLEGLYQGEIVWPKQADAEETFFESLLPYIFQKEESGLQTFEMETSKKRMLLYYTSEDVPAYFELMQLLTSSLDYGAWDVTCLCEEPASAAEEDRLSNLAPEVRILYAASNFNAGSEVYLEQQYVLQNLLYFKEIDQAARCLDPTVLKSEFQTVLGPGGFDRFLQFGDFSVEGICLALSMPVRQAEKIELTDFSQKKNACGNGEAAFKLHDQLRLCGLAFRKIVFPTENLKQKALDTGDFAPARLQVYKFPSLLPDAPTADACEKVSFRGRPYAVCRIREQDSQNLSLQIVPCLEAGEKGYLIDARQTDPAVLFERIGNEKDFCADKWFAAGIKTGDLDRIAALPAPTGAVVVLDTFFLETWPDLYTYLQQFAGYLTIREDDPSPLRAAMEFSGKAVFLCAGDGIRQIDDRRFPDLDAYDRTVREEQAAFLNDRDPDPDCA